MVTRRVAPRPSLRRRATATSRTPSQCGVDHHRRAARRVSALSAPRNGRPRTRRHGARVLDGQAGPALGVPPRRFMGGPVETVWFGSALRAAPIEPVAVSIGASGKGDLDSGCSVPRCEQAITGGCAPIWALAAPRRASHATVIASGAASRARLATVRPCRQGRRLRNSPARCADERVKAN